MPTRPRAPLRVLLLLVLLTGSLGPTTTTANGDKAATLYAVDESYERVVQPLDPTSLADAGPPMAIARGPVASSSFWMSGDGSTAVVGHHSIEGADVPLNLRVLDLRSGQGGATIVVPGREGGVAALSHDGSRLLVTTSRYDGEQGGYTATWTVHSTATGAALSAYELTGLDPFWLAPYVDRAVEHMWLQSSTVTPSDGPWEPRMGSVVLRHVDLAMGIEVGRLTLGSVEVGDIERNPIDDQPASESVQPAIALSPDGRTLAIVEPTTEEIVLVDGLTMTRTSTVTVGQPEGVASRLLRWAGVLPSPAAAKMQIGAWREATFSDDGDALYLTGGHGEIVGDSYQGYEAEWIGVVRVDLATGRIEATAFAGDEVYRVVTGAGDALYVTSQERPYMPSVDGSDPPTTLHRLDPRTLEIVAERSFPQTTHFVLTRDEGVPRVG